MNTNMPTSFETFYFHELLSNIRRDGQENYDQEELSYLEKLLAYLEDEDDANKSIEKLAGSLNTSDMAIFFADIIEQLYQIPPENAMQRLQERAADFTELFRLSIQNEQWKQEMAHELNGISYPEEANDISLQDYCEKVLQEKISSKIAGLTPDRSAHFQQQLHEFIDDARLAEALEKRLNTPEAADTAALLRLLDNSEAMTHQTDDYMGNFETRAQSLVDLFFNLQENHGDTITLLLHPVRDSEAEEPLENLFADAENILEEDPAFGEFERVESELSSLVADVEEFDEQRKRPAEPTEEERERRKFLKDYVIGEIATFHEDILERLDALLDDSGSDDAQHQLNESLKGMRDLGQIHAYPAIEDLATNFSTIFTQLFQEGRVVPEESKTHVNHLLGILPDYIEAALLAREQGFIDQMNSGLKDLRDSLLEERHDQEFAELKTMHNSFQDIFARSVQKIGLEIQENHFRAENLDPVFSNLAYWTQLLKLTEAAKAIETVKSCLKSAEYKTLDNSGKSAIAAALGRLEQLNIDASAAAWEDHIRPFRLEAQPVSDIFSAFPEESGGQLPVSSEVPVGDALPSLLDVADRHISQLQNTLHAGISVQEILHGPLHGFVKQLHQNAAIIGHSDLGDLSDRLHAAIGGIADDGLQVNEQAREQLDSFLADLRSGLANLPAKPDTVALVEQLGALDNTPEAYHLDGALDDLASLADDSDSEEHISFLSDETQNDIMEIFHKEAHVYVREVRAYLENLQDNISDAEAWRGMGVSAHTLKGSAQMVGQSGVTQLAEPLDMVVELVEEQQLRTSPELLGLLAEVADAVDKCLQGGREDSTGLLANITAYIAANSGDALATETEPGVEPEDSIVFTFGDAEGGEPVSESSEALLAEAAGTQQESAEEVPEELSGAAEGVTESFIQLSEEDPELLQIFNSEVSSNFDLVEKNLTNLTKFGYDKEALQQIERAVHEIRGAAKMLGIGEIAHITDKLERIFELLVQRRHEDLPGVIGVTRRSMLVIRELSTEHRVKQELYDEVEERLTHIIEQYDRSDSAATDDMPGQTEEAPDSSGHFPQQFATPAEEVPAFLEEEEEARPKPAPHLLEVYVQEAREQLDDINYLLLKLEKHPENEELQHHLMRCMHTLKGSSGMVTANHIEALSHRCEDIVEKTINSKKPLPADLFNLLFEVVDEITLILDHFQHDAEEKTRNFNDVQQKLNTYFAAMSPEAPSQIPLQELQPALRKSQAESAISAETKSDSPQKATYLRLNINKMNHLLNLAAELVVSNNQFKTQLDRLKNFFPMLNSNLKMFRDTEDYISTTLREEKRLQESMHKMAEDNPATQDSMKKQVDNIQRTLKNIRSLQDEITSITHTLKENSKAYDENLQKLNKLSNELLDEIMQARLVPIDLLFQRFHRPIRDLANQLKKQIKLTISGENTELDRTLVDELYEPLIHIIRNSIDHGLETVEERQAVGKDPEGHVAIKAYRDRNQIIVEISDDGRGIQLDKVKKSAIAKGLLKEEDADNMSEQEAFEFLFYPGFSTASEITLVSGRGVGLDAVKNQIEKSKGDIRMSTVPGKGTTITIRVPISLSVIQSMLTDVAGQVYSIPLLQVEETLHVSAEDLIREGEGNFIMYREKKIPVVVLGKLLRIREDADDRLSQSGSYPVIMVQDEGQRVALLVDKIIRREEILIKSLGPGLRRLKYISGGSIMADGQVVLVVDIPQIIQDIQRGIPLISSEDLSVAGREAASAAPREVTRPAVRSKPPRKRIEGRKPMALIVDDSLSIRKYLSSLLLQKGYQTDTARNGYEALELLNKNEFDIMVTDLEMPKLSGYELIETLRYDKRFATFPIIVLTGRAGENFRQLTSELGADAYIVKPFKDRELFDQLERFIDYKM